MRALGKMLAFTLACAVFFPQAYIGFLSVQTVHAAEVEGMVKKALPEAVAGATMCSMGGWVSGLLSDFASWLGWISVLTSGTTGSAVTADASIALASEVHTAGAADAALKVPVYDSTVAFQNDVMDLKLEASMLNLEATKSATVQTAKETSSVTFWNCVLKRLIVVIRETVIRAMTDDILAWIRGGFEGQPAFLTDPKRFFSSLAEHSISAFLFDSGMDEYLCSPFRIDIIFNFMWTWQRPPHSQFGELSCSLDEIFSQGVDLNIGIQSVSAQSAEMKRAREAFGGAYQSGVFRSGGYTAIGGGTESTGPSSYGLPSSYKMTKDKSGKWGYTRDSGDEFKKVVTKGLVNTVSMGMTGLGMLGKSNNNAVYQYLRTGEEAMKRMQETTAKEKGALDQNGGWFSQRCDMDGDGKLDGMCTPGSFIAKQVDQHTNSILTQLTLADEFGEILDALLQALIQKILDKAQGDYGLLRVRTTADTNN